MIGSIFAEFNANHSAGLDNFRIEFQLDIFMLTQIWTFYKSLKENQHSINHDRLDRFQSNSLRKLFGKIIII